MDPEEDVSHPEEDMIDPEDTPMSDPEPGCEHNLFSLTIQFNNHMLSRIRFIFKQSHG